jgi:hypothetical protein
LTSTVRHLTALLVARSVRLITVSMDVCTQMCESCLKVDAFGGTLCSGGCRSARAADGYLTICDNCVFCFVQERKKDKKRKGAEAVAADMPDIEQFEDEAVAAAALLLEEEVLALKEVGAAPAFVLPTSSMQCNSLCAPASCSAWVRTTAAIASSDMARR